MAEKKNSLDKQRSNQFFSLATGLTLSKLTGFLRLLALAYVLGLGPTADAFNLANTTPNMIHDLVIGTLVTSAVIPLFSKVLATKKDGSSDESLSVLVSYLGILTVVSTIAFELLAPYIIRAYSLGVKSSFSANTTELAILFLRLFAPQVLFYGFITIATALLNTNGVFSPVGFSGAVSNIFQILVLIELAVVAKHPSVTFLLDHKLVLFFLGFATTASLAAQFLYLIPSLARLRLNIIWRFSLNHPIVRDLYKIAGYNAGIVLANQCALFINLALASIVKIGAVSALSYAYIFLQLPFGIITVSFSSTMMPRLTHLIVNHKDNSAKITLSRSLKGNLSLIFPIAGLYLVIAKPLFSLILYHSHLQSSQLNIAAGALKMLALGLPGFSSFFLLTRALQACFKTRAAFLLYLLQNVTNILLALALHSSMGLNGICLSISISYTLGAVIAFIYVAFFLRLLRIADLFVHLLKVFFMTIVVVFLCALTAAIFPQQSFTEILTDTLLASIAAIASYFALSFMLSLTA